MISSIWLCSNGQVMVFDEAGEQIPGYQYNIYNFNVEDDKSEMLLTDAPLDTSFTYVDWSTGERHAISWESFATQTKEKGEGLSTALSSAMRRFNRKEVQGG